MMSDSSPGSDEAASVLLPRGSRTKALMSSKSKRCQALCCTADLKSTGRAYCIKRGLCPEHIKADAIKREGHGNELWRFCQQCGKLEPLARFQGDKRSCSAGLKKRRLTTTGNSNGREKVANPLLTAATPVCPNTAAAANCTRERVAHLQLQIQSMQDTLQQLKQDTLVGIGMVSNPSMSSTRSGFNAAADNSSSDSERLAAAVAEGYLRGLNQMQQQNTFDGCHAFDQTSYSPTTAAAAGRGGRDWLTSTAAVGLRQAVDSTQGAAPTAAAAAPVRQMSTVDWLMLASADDYQFSSWLQQWVQPGDTSTPVRQVPTPCIQAHTTAVVAGQHTEGYKATALPAVITAGVQRVPPGPAATGEPAMSEADIDMMIELELWRLANGFA